MNSNFNDAPFAAGSFRGWRTFLIEPEHDGFLVGPMYPQYIVPGVNKAFCLGEPVLGAIRWGHPQQVNLWNEELREYGFVKTMPSTLRIFNDQHVGSMDCACGFYCYWDDGYNPYGAHWNKVMTIIEGYGRTTYGNRGFRCARMKIIGLVKPPLSGETQPAKVGFTRRERLQLAGAVLAPIACLTLAALSISLFVSVVACALTPMSILYLALPPFLHRAIRREAAAAQLRLDEESVVTPEMWEKVVARYPDAQVFDTLEEARAALPTTNPHETGADDVTG